MAYLLALALAKPEPGCELLFERTFDSVHGDIAAARLPYDAFNALARYLPSVHWWQQWDTCLRLRKAVAEAYVDNDLNPESFKRLTTDSTLYEELINRVTHTRNGHRFLKLLSQSQST